MLSGLLRISGISRLTLIVIALLQIGGAVMDPLAFSQNPTPQYSNCATLPRVGSSSKPALTLQDLGTTTDYVSHQWPIAEGERITNDGKYVSYDVVNLPGGRSCWVLNAVGASWKTEIPNATPVGFTPDSRYAVFIKPRNNLCYMTLGAATAQCTPSVASARIERHGAVEWLVYQSSTPDKTLTLRDLHSNKEQSFPRINQYAFSPDGKLMALLAATENVDGDTESMDLVAVSNGNRRTVFQGKQISLPVFSRDGAKIAFTTEDKQGSGVVRSIWYYAIGDERARVLIKDGSPALPDQTTLGGITRFSVDGDRIFITLNQRSTPIPEPNPDAVQVNVWSYKDPKVQSEQLYNLGRAVPPFFNDPTSRRAMAHYAAVLDIRTSRVIQLQHEYEQSNIFDDFAFVTKELGDHIEGYWNPSTRPHYYLESTRTGVRTPVKMGTWGGMSPDGKYLMLVDQMGRDFYSYDVATGLARNITRNIPIPLIDAEDDASGAPKRRGLLPVGWLHDGSGILFYDRYDIWEVDPAGKRPPVGVTNGYGRRHNIVFRLSGSEICCERAILNSSTLLLAALNRKTKENGFYRKTLGVGGDPVQLTMGPYLYSAPLHSPGLTGFSPIKAKDADIWVVQRQTAAESPNFFWTKDFKSFHVISDVHPERNFNWLTTQLVSWKAFDGTISQGVLYKPENFDPQKKYPVIVFFYEKLSDEMHLYRQPAITIDDMNIPWFVSRGYVVFTPDIYYTIGKPGESAYNDIVSGARYITKFPWVDAKKMGLYGHSFGGFETDYVVTHSGMFAAAISACGVSDLVSEYGSTDMTFGFGLQVFNERGQLRMGVPLWESPAKYIANSAVFRANKVTTPILLMNNNEDSIVSFLQQGVPWFLDLRRAGKKVWMLEYEGEAHNLAKAEDGLDYTHRITQFLDYYLKGALPPVWMTRGVSARLKGIENGSELDASGAKP